MKSRTSGSRARVFFRLPARRTRRSRYSRCRSVAQSAWPRSGVRSQT